MVQIAWVAAVALEATAFTLIALSQVISFIPGGSLGIIVIANLLVALGVAVGMVGAGVLSPIALAVAPLLILFALLTVSVFQWFGPGVRL